MFSLFVFVDSDFLVLELAILNIISLKTHLVLTRKQYFFFFDNALYVTGISKVLEPHQKRAFTFELTFLDHTKNYIDAYIKTYIQIMTNTHPTPPHHLPYQGQWFCRLL